MSSQESERKIFDYEFYPHSYVRTAPGFEEIMDLSEGEERRRAITAREKLENLEVKNKKYKLLVEKAKQDLVELYGQAGVDIKESDFPRIYFIPAQYKNDFNSDSGTAGLFGGKGLAIIIYVEKTKFLLLLANIIHHELHHSLGRKALVKEIGPGAVSVQVGHRTSANHTSKRGEKICITRGRVLEEAVVSYFSDLFAITSTKMSKTRKRFASLCKDNASWYEFLFGVRNNNEATQLVSDFFTLNSSEYYQARRMIEVLVEGAVKVDGEAGGEKMKHLLLRSRIFPKERIKLRNYIDRLYGKGTTKQIFRCAFDLESLGILQSFLQVAIVFAKSH